MTLLTTVIIVYYVGVAALFGIGMAILLIPFQSKSQVQSFVQNFSTWAYSSAQFQAFKDDNLNIFSVYSSLWFGTIRTKIAAATDARLSLVNTFFNNILLVKMYTWEAPMESLVRKARASEISLLKKRAIFNGSIASLLQVSPKISFFVTILLYIYQGYTLDAETVGQKQICSIKVFI